MRTRWTDSETAKYFIQRFGGSNIYEAVERASQKLREPLLVGFEKYCSLPVDVEEIADRLRVLHGGKLPDDDARRGALLFQAGEHVALTAAVGTLGSDRLILAHEIGHTLFRNGARHMVQSIAAVEKTAEDAICWAFASALLMPSLQIAHAIQELRPATPWVLFKNLENAAARFAVSLPALIIRMGQVKAKSAPCLMLLCLSYFENKYRNDTPCLRVGVCSQLGKSHDIRTWHNRSAVGLGLISADSLFAAWALATGDSGERTGGRYVLGPGMELVTASPRVLRWIPEDLNLSVRVRELWQKRVVRANATSCLYAKKGWHQDRAYIIAAVATEELSRR
jgi:hypothetical protein